MLISSLRAKLVDRGASAGVTGKKKKGWKKKGMRVGIFSFAWWGGLPWQKKPRIVGGKRGGKKRKRGPPPPLAQRPVQHQSKARILPDCRCNRKGPWAQNTDFSDSVPGPVVSREGNRRKEKKKGAKRIPFRQGLNAQSAQKKKKKHERSWVNSGKVGRMKGKMRDWRKRKTGGRKGKRGRSQALSLKSHFLVTGGKEGKQKLLWEKGFKFFSFL